MEKSFKNHSTIDQRFKKSVQNRTNNLQNLTEKHAKPLAKNVQKSMKNRSQEAFRLGLHFFYRFWIDLATQLRPSGPSELLFFPKKN